MRGALIGVLAAVGTVTVAMIIVAALANAADAVRRLRWKRNALRENRSRWDAACAKSGAVAQVDNFGRMSVAFTEGEVTTTITQVQGFDWIEERRTRVGKSMRVKRETPPVQVSRITRAISFEE